MIRSKKIAVLSVSLATLLLSAAPSAAQGQASTLLLSLQGIPGDSLTEFPPPSSNEKWIDVLSFAWGVSNPASVGTGTKGISSGLPAFADLSVLLFGGKAVPDLVIRTANGKVIPTARLVVLENNGDFVFARYELEFTNAILTAFQSSGSSNDRPTHSLSLAYEKIKITVNTQNPDGTLGTPSVSAWSLVENKKQ